MRNNKFTRKRAQKLAAKDFVQQLDGTEVLRTKEARQKLRRWSFVADMGINLPESKDNEGNAIPASTLPTRAMKLDAISYGTAKEARLDSTSQAEYLRNSAPIFKSANIVVRAIPHETISRVTLSQINGYRDMAMILDKALALSIKEAADIVSGRSVGSQFIESEAVLASEGIEAKPARTSSTIKEDFYKRALEELRPSEKQEEPVTPLVSVT